MQTAKRHLNSIPLLEDPFLSTSLRGGGDLPGTNDYARQRQALKSEQARGQWG